MNHYNYNLDDLFASWGRKEQRLPQHNETLKREALSKLIAPALSEKSPFSPRPFPWPSLVLAGIGAFIFIMGTYGNTARPMSVVFTQPVERRDIPAVQEAPGAPIVQPSKDQVVVSPGSQGVSTGASMESPFFAKESIAREPYFSPPVFDDREIPITDTREFLKTDYYARLRTRRVEELTDRLALTIRGLGGRVDSATHSRQHGFVEFVIPANEFALFRTEIESMVPGRFLIQNVTTENLLPQKQSIEQEREGLDSALTKLTSDRKQAVSAHNQTIAAIQSRLNSIVNELATIDAKRGGTSKEKAARAARKKELLSEQSMLLIRQFDENAAYATRISSLDARIRNAQAGIRTNDEHDQDLLDTVATVRGRVSLDWISVWEIVSFYASPYWGATFLFLVLAIIAYILHLRRYRFSY